jgi:hypothetical protein
VGTIAVTDPNIDYIGGPFGGAVGNGLCVILGSGSATFVNPSTFRFALNHLVSDTATLNFTSISHTSSQTMLKVIVDYAQVIAPTSIASTASLSLGAFPAGVHTYTVEIVACDFGYWTQPLTHQALNLTSITTANGSLTVPVTGFNTGGLCLSLGDSVNAGGNVLGSNNGDGSLVFHRAMADAFGLELANANYPGIGYLQATVGGGGDPVPGIGTSYTQIISGQNRVWPSNLKMVIVPGNGRNDTNNGVYDPAQYTTAVVNFYAALRATLVANGLTTCKIVAMPSWSGVDPNGSGYPWTSAQLTAVSVAAFQQYQTTSKDPYFYIAPFNLNAQDLTYFHTSTGGSPATYFAQDNTHPQLAGHEFLAATSMYGAMSALTNGPRVGSPFVGV